VTYSAGRAHSERHSLELQYAAGISSAISASLQFLLEEGEAVTAASLRSAVALTVASVRSAWQAAVARTRFASDHRLDRLPDRIYSDLSEPPRPGSRDWQRLALGYARTMATSDFGQQTLERLAAQGQPAKRWVAHHDDHTREEHRDIDGTAVPLGLAFIVGGSPMQYPGDPSVPPELTYNCRCVLIAASRPSPRRAILSLASHDRSTRAHNPSSAQRTGRLPARYLPPPFSLRVPPDGRRTAASPAR